MNNKQKAKLIAYLTASSMLLYGCKMSINNFFNKKQQEVPKKDFNTEQATEESEIKETELIFETTLETEIPETTKEVTTIPTETEIETIITESTEVPETTITSTTEIPEETEVPEEIITVSNEIIVKATANVNIRSNNNPNAVIIGELNKNDIAYKIMSCENNWDLVKVGNIIGYVCRDYLDYTDKTYEIDYKYTPKTDIVITKSELNFRELPTTEANKISTFNKNTELELIATLDNEWLLVRNNGTIGYVHGNYVVSLLELANLEYPELNLEKIDIQKNIYVTASYLNIRKGNGTDYESVGTLETYESARVLGEYDGWYFIMTNEYKFGFINKQYTKDMDNNYVIIDKSEQRLYLYNDDELLFVTPVTTGKDETPSDTGLFKIYDRTQGRYLKGEDYNVWVDYWMAYNGGEGLHDASWRYVFGTEAYHTSGSHGCINIPSYLADDIYNNTSYETKVLVHK